jgi:multidrug efflux pump subunit AcrB
LFGKSFLSEVTVFDIEETILVGVVMVLKLFVYLFAVMFVVVLVPLWLPFWLLGMIVAVRSGGCPIDNDASLGG